MVVLSVVIQISLMQDGKFGDKIQESFDFSSE